MLTISLLIYINVYKQTRLLFHSDMGRKIFKNHCWVDKCAQIIQIESTTSCSVQTTYLLASDFQNLPIGYGNWFIGIYILIYVFPVELSTSHLLVWLSFRDLLHDGKWKTYLRVNFQYIIWEKNHLIYFQLLFYYGDLYWPHS